MPEEIENPHLRGVLLVCEEGHNYFVPFSCRARDPSKDDYCMARRSKIFLAKLFSKMEVAGIDFDSKFYMWTLGSSLDDTYLEGEGGLLHYPELIRNWQLFNTRMKVYSKRYGFVWDPLVYVVESGSSGGKLHIHLITEGFVPHEVALRNWRDIRGENANVNFVQGAKLGYLAKYSSKSLLAYRFLGRLYKAKVPKVSKGCKVDGSKFYLEDFCYNPELQEEYLRNNNFEIDENIDE